MKQILAIALLLMILPACGKDNEGNSGGGGSDPANVRDAHVEGAWQIPCLGGSLELKLNVTQDSIAFTSGFYETGDQCSSPDRRIQTIRMGYTRAGTIAGTNPLKHKLNTTPISNLVTFYGTEVARANEEQYCGLTDWTEGVAREISQLNCEADEREDGGTPLYSTYQIVDGKLRVEQVIRLKDGAIQSSSWPLFSRAP